MLVKEFIEEVRIELEDSGKPEGISGSSGLIESIRTALDDHGSSGVIPDAETKLIACLRRNLDDPEDVGKAVSMANIMNDVSQDVNYAYWNGGSAERYYAEGVADIIAKRPDAKYSGSVRSAFKDALSAYVLMRAFEGEIETSPDAMRYQLFRKKYQEELASVPYHWNNDDLLKCLQHGAVDLVSKRPDALFSGSVSGLAGIRKEFTDALEAYGAARALERRFGQQAAADARWKTNADRYQQELAAVPYHWSDNLLKQFIADAVAEIASVRPDALIGSGISIESIRAEYRPAIVAYAVAKARETRIGKDASGDTLWKINMEKFQAELKTQPYHWSDEELLMYLNNSIADIAFLRPDARMDEEGEEIDLETVGLDDLFPFPGNLKTAAKSYVIFSAIERRFGADAQKSELWKINSARYKKEIGAR